MARKTPPITRVLAGTMWQWAGSSQVWTCVGESTLRNAVVLVTANLRRHVDRSQLPGKYWRAWDPTLEPKKSTAAIDEMLGGDDG